MRLCRRKLISTQVTSFWIQFATKYIVRIFLFSLFLIASIICIIIISTDSKDGTYTIIIDVRENRTLTTDTYLSSHPWRHASSEDEIREKLGLTRDGQLSTGVLGICPEVPYNLSGDVKALSSIHDFHTLEILHAKMHGRFEPKTCRSRQKVAIIVPYRNREHHLLVLLHNIIPFLEKQLVDFTIVVVNQALPSTFNRAMLFNIGFLEASKIYPYDCFIFHDVDLLPINDRNLYNCGPYPRHMSVAIDKFCFRPIGPTAFGGVVSFSRESYLRVNGASNLYFGWGGEDDDLYRRVNGSNMVVVTHPLSVSRYSMIKHDRDVSNGINPQRLTLLDNAVARMSKDGLNTIQYKRRTLQVTKLFLWVDVEVDEQLIWKTAPADLTLSLP